MLGESPCIIFTCGFVYIVKNRACVSWKTLCTNLLLKRPLRVKSPPPPWSSPLLLQLRFRPDRGKVKRKVFPPRELYLENASPFVVPARTLKAGHIVSITSYDNK